MTLAQRGADVIRVDPARGRRTPSGSRWPRRASLYRAGLNKGKRPVTLDFRSAEGRATVPEAADRAWPAYALYVGHHQLRKNPEIAARQPDRIDRMVAVLTGGRNP